MQSKLCLKFDLTWLVQCRFLLHVVIGFHIKLVKCFFHIFRYCLHYIYSMERLPEGVLKEFLKGKSCYATTAWNMERNMVRYVH